MNEDYLSFDKVLKELQIQEDELKKLVSAGEIKAFRDADQMKFKREEIDKLKEDKSSSPDVIELLDAEDEGEAESAPTMDSDSSAGELTEELSFDDEEEEVGMTTAQISEDEFLSEELVVEDDEGGMDLGTIDLDEEGTLGDRESGARGGRRIVGRSKVAAMADEEEEVEPQWALGLLIVSAIVLVLGVLVMMDVASSTPSPVVQWLVGIF